MRSSVLDMYVVVVTDDMMEYAESNTLVLLTCNTYVVYDQRSPSERARIEVLDVVAEMRRNAIAECKQFAFSLANRGRKDLLELMYNRLANEECRTYVKELMADSHTGGGNAKIEI